MDITITPKKLSGEIAAIDSKSHAHRLLIAYAMARSCDTVCPDREKSLSSERTSFSDEAADMITDMSEDLSATTCCLQALLTEDTPHLFCGESGSTIRFLLPLCLTNRGAAFYGKGKLPERPLAPLDSELMRHGAMIERPGDVSRKEDLPLRQADQDLICYAFLPEGRALSGGDYMMPGHISSQYITGLLMALPLIGEDSRIVVTTELQSRSYIDITLGVLRDFGIDIKVEEKMAGYPVYHIKGGQKYSVPNGSASQTLRPEGDWSNAAFWLTAQALGSDIHVSGLNDASAQGDRAISEILERFRLRSDDPSVDPSDDPVIIDARSIPDLVPVISVMASLSPGQTRIVNAGRLRIKESDRLKTTAAMLCALGADISETKDGLIIHGKTQLAGGTADGAGDHRIVMSAAIAATCCSEPVTILGAQASAKSYPAFFEHYRRAGGEFFER